MIEPKFPFRQFFNFRSTVNFYSIDEWQLYFPGEKYRKTFPDLPGPD
jgi:hypothetical protein